MLWARPVTVRFAIVYGRYMICRRGEAQPQY